MSRIDWKPKASDAQRREIWRQGNTTGWGTTRRPREETKAGMLTNVPGKCAVNSS